MPQKEDSGKSKRKKKQRKGKKGLAKSETSLGTGV